MNRLTRIGVVFGTALAFNGAAMADFTFPAFSAVGDVAQTTTWQGQNLLSLAVPTPGTYVGYEVLVDWTSTGNSPTTSLNAFSSEANVALASAAASGSSVSSNPPTYPGGTTVYAGVQFPANGAANPTNVNNLRFTNGFTNFYSSGPLFLNFSQDFAAFSTQDVTWSNIRVTLRTLVTPASCINLGQINSSNLTFNTEGSVLSGTNDTEIAVYTSGGVKLGEDDDAGTGNLSSLNLLGLPAGVYYIAAAGFDATFNPGFLVTTNSTATGNMSVNVTDGVQTLSATTPLSAGQVQWYCVTVPTPGSVGLVGGCGLLAMRRRRTSA